jgi:hypothetical protein
MSTSYGKISRGKSVSPPPAASPVFLGSVVKSYNPEEAIPQSIKSTVVAPPAPKHNHGDHDLANPAYCGPGVWFVIHMTAKRAGETGYNGKKKFVDLMNDLRATFPCLTCREHIGKYLDTHPFEPYWTLTHKSTGKDWGLMLWSTNFHNFVNERLKKPLMTEEQAYDLYYTETGTCSLDCGH